MAEILRNGDILVFTAGSDWVGKVIARLTQSDVSHAAMVYRDGQMIEMGFPGIQINKVTAEKGGRFYVMRLDPERDPGPLILAADRYFSAKDTYDIPAVVMLGGLLIYLNMRPTPELARVTDLILRAAIRVLDKLIRTVTLRNRDDAIVYSQLVYQIYNDCGKDYQIHLTGGILQNARNEKDSIRLIDLVKNSPKESGTLWESAENTAKEAGTSQENVEDDPEKLARLLYMALGDDEYDENKMLNAAKPLISPARRLLEQLETLLEKCNTDIPIDALFVTPADFVYHAENLRQIDVVNIFK